MKTRIVLRLGQCEEFSDIYRYFHCRGILESLVPTTSQVSWRWCFYINLPIGAFTILVILAILKLPKPPIGSLTLRQQVEQLDPIGTLCFLSSIIGIKIWKGDSATIPPRIITIRTIACGFCCMMCFSAVMMLLIYYLSIYFQAIKNADAISSGVRTIPLVLSLVLGIITAGVFTQSNGYHTPMILIAPFFLATGTGLLTTLKVDTGHAKWIGYQIPRQFRYRPWLSTTKSGSANRSLSVRRLNRCCDKFLRSTAVRRDLPRCSTEHFHTETDS